MLVLSAYIPSVDPGPVRGNDVLLKTLDVTPNRLDASSISPVGKERPEVVALRILKVFDATTHELLLLMLTPT